MRFSALASGLRLFRVPDCFSRQLIVSALYKYARASGRRLQGRGGNAHLLISSKKCFRLRAVSSRPSVISATVILFHLILRLSQLEHCSQFVRKVRDPVKHETPDDSHQHGSTCSQRLFPLWALFKFTSRMLAVDVAVLFSFGQCGGREGGRRGGFGFGRELEL
jgi:hypothetical protein